MGRNEYGQLADNTTEGRTTFVPMVHAWPAGVAVTAMSTGYRFTMVLAGMARFASALRVVCTVFHGHLGGLAAQLFAADRHTSRALQL